MDNKNLLLAVFLSAIILAGFQYLYVKPQQEHYRQQVLAEKAAQPAKPESAPENVPVRERAAIIAETPRVPISTPQLKGSVALRGARIDDLLLTQYRETVDPASPQITLLSPAGSAAPHSPYYAEFSWLSGDAAMPVPTEQTEWKAEGAELSPAHPLKLSWDNGRGLAFERTISIDDHFMFTITDDVRNKGAGETILYPFGFVRRQGTGDTASSVYIHEGPLGVLDGTLEEIKYKDLIASRKKTIQSDGGWLGITDKYWLVALVPPQDEKIAGEFAYTNPAKLDATHGSFQADFRGAPVTLAPGASVQHVTRLFAGAKTLNLLDHYADQYNIPRFDRAVDFGRFYWLAEPFLYLLDYLATIFGNFALAILVFTVLLKIVTLPLSLKSYRAMAKMKALQPELKRIQERYADDKVRQGSEMMELYKREKVNPTSGCFPTLIQIPIFFALYKVLYVGIEMRQAPFYGWIKDLSMPDPSSIVTLFGLFPNAAVGLQHAIDFMNTLPSLVTIFGLIPGMLSSLLHISIWPIFMGISMFLQQKLSPQPPDKAQARVFMLMPIIFTFMLAQMPAGLVIYWTWSNLLSIGQQWYIMYHSRIQK